MRINFFLGNSKKLLASFKFMFVIKGRLDFRRGMSSLAFIAYPFVKSTFGFFNFEGY